MSIVNVFYRQCEVRKWYQEASNQIFFCNPTISTDIVGLLPVVVPLDILPRLNYLRLQDGKLVLARGSFENESFIKNFGFLRRVRINSITDSYRATKGVEQDISTAISGGFSYEKVTIRDWYTLCINPFHKSVTKHSIRELVLAISKFYTPVLVNSHTHLECPPLLSDPDICPDFWNYVGEVMVAVNLKVFVCFKIAVTRHMPLFKDVVDDPRCYEVFMGYLSSNKKRTFKEIDYYRNRCFVPDKSCKPSDLRFVDLYEKVYPTIPKIRLAFLKRMVLDLKYILDNK